MQLCEVVEASNRIAATRSRKVKIDTLAQLLTTATSDELPVAVGFLTGEPRQGKIGIGWATLSSVEGGHVPAPSLALLDVDRRLGALAATTGAGSQATRQSMLSELLGLCTKHEGDFLRRLLIGELRQGALDGIMADAVARGSGCTAALVRQAAMLAGDLSVAAVAAFGGGDTALQAIGLRVGVGVLPMLAATSASATEAVVECGLSSVEWKLDGARIQVHRRGSEVRIYTRNLNDITDRLDDVRDVALGLACEQFVLDGEVLGFFEDERPHAFQDTISSFSRDVTSHRLRPYFFDCLHADGADLLERPLSERLEVLDRVVGDRAIPRVVTADGATAERFLAQAVDAGHEGVMVKAIGSRYEAGRRGQAWRKVKPVHTLDLVVLAAEWGHGRRQGWLSNLHLGARVPSDTQESSAHDSYVMVGKTFKGLTDALLTWQTSELLAREVTRHGIAVVVRPELVVEIALDGVQRSTRYPGGVALRFARVRRYRSDKTPADADDLDAVRRLLPRA